MKTLLDHNLPAQLEPLLGDMVSTARDMRWDDLENGDLLFAAESAGFDIMITGDQNLTYEQNNLKRIISLIVITQTKRAIVTSHYARISDAITLHLPAATNSCRCHESHLASER